MIDWPIVGVGQMRTVLLMVACVVLLAGCSGGDEQKSAGDAATRHYEFIDKNQWGRYYDELHPLQQVFVNRDKFIECSAANRLTVGIKVTKVIEIYDEELVIPGTETKAQSKAVTVELEGSSGGRTEKVKNTTHVFDVDGKWRWMLGADTIAAFKESKCAPK